MNMPFLSPAATALILSIFVPSGAATGNAAPAPQLPTDRASASSDSEATLHVRRLRVLEELVNEAGRLSTQDGDSMLLVLMEYLRLLRQEARENKHQAERAGTEAKITELIEKIERRRGQSDETAGRTLGRPRPSAQEVGPAAGINPSVYDQLVGRYSVAPSHVITVTREGDRLFAHYLDAAQPEEKRELLPHSEVRFFTDPPGIVVWFAKDTRGRVASIRIDYRDRSVRALRLPN